VKCLPDPDLMWFNDEERIQPSEKYVIEGERGFQRLTIECLGIRDQGTWRCIAVNSYGQAMTTCQLTVLGKLFLDAALQSFLRTFCESCGSLEMPPLSVLV